MPRPIRKNSSKGQTDEALTIQQRMASRRMKKLANKIKIGKKALKKI